MTLKELIQIIDKDIEILDAFSKKSFYGMKIDYVSFKIGSHYYLVSKSKSPFYVLTEQTADRSRDISEAKGFDRTGLIDYIERLLILDN